MTNWDDIRAEYIVSGIGYRELAAKHNVSFSTLQKKAKKECWPAARQVTRDMSVSAIDKTNGVTQVTIPVAEAAEYVNDVAALLLAKIEITLKYVDGKRSGQTVKNCADALKTVREILGVKTEAEQTEQSLRIDKLRKELDSGAADNEVTVTFVDGGDWTG